MLSGKGNIDAINSLAMHVIFWDGIKLESRRGTLCELILFAAHVGSKGDPRSF